MIKLGQQIQNNYSKNIYTVKNIIGFKIYLNDNTYIQHNSLTKYFKLL